MLRAKLFINAVVIAAMYFLNSAVFAGLFGAGDPKEIAAAGVRADIASGHASKYFKDSDLAMLHKIAGAQGVFVPGFRVQYAIAGEAQARSAGSTSSSTTRGAAGSLFTTLTSSSAQNVKMRVRLEGVSNADLQAITEKLYLDFMQQLKDSGINVLDSKTMKASEGFRKLQATPTPYNQDTQQGRSKVEMRMFTPRDLPLWFTNGEGDKSPFDLNNVKAVGQISYEQNAIAVVPQITVSFIKMESTGNSVWFPTNARVQMEQAAFVPYMQTYLFSLYQDNPVMGDGRRAHVQEIFTVPGAIGEVVDVTSQATRDDDNLKNTVSGTLNLLGKLGGVNTSGNSYSTKEMAIRTTPEAFGKIALDAGTTVTKLYASVVTAYGKGTGKTPTAGSRKTMSVSEALQRAGQSQEEPGSVLDL